jgi:hypothetical protein
LIFVFVAFCVKFHILSQFLNLNNFYWNTILRL